MKPTITGSRLNVRQAGNGTAILLIHGLLMNGDMFEPVIEELSTSCRVLAPDLRGFGRSGHLAPPYTVEQHKGLTPEQTKQLETIISSNHKSRMVEATKAMLRFDSRHRLPEIKCPTRVLAGAKDTAVPLHHAHMLAQGIAGAELSVIPHAGHEMIWTHGVELIDRVKRFLRTAARPSTPGAWPVTAEGMRRSRDSD